MVRADGAFLAGRPVLRKTLQREEIVAVLRASDRFRSAQEIHAELHATGARVGLTTVYRHLQLLADEGRIHSVQSGDRTAVYRWCADGHHHHLVCRHCGSGVEIPDGLVGEWVRTTATERGYTDVTHTFEIFGLCPECGSWEENR